jgi:hypothetical protein
MNIIINPGSGPVEDATLADATANISRFVIDLDSFAIITYERKSAADGRGRFGFTLTSQDNGNSVEVQMPGLPLEQVRFISGDPWPFPRLYVDGDSWLWRFALNVVARALTGDVGPYGDV